MSFNWNEEKNQLLKAERGISFERIVVAIEEGHLLARLLQFKIATISIITIWRF